MANSPVSSHRGGKGGYEPSARVHERRRRVWELSVQGFSQGDIARQLGVTQSAVSRILHKLIEEDRVVFRRQRQLARALEFVRLTTVYRESMEAYERSKAPRTTRRRRQSTRNNVTVADVTEVVVVERDGDPRYLARANAALEQLRRAVREDDEPHASVGVRNVSEGPTIDPKALNDEELQQFIILAQKAVSRGGPVCSS